MKLEAQQRKVRLGNRSFPVRDEINKQLETLRVGGADRFVIGC